MIKNKPYKLTKKHKLSYLQQIAKKSQIPQNKNSLVSWNNMQGIQCKRIIQPNRCFCTHSFSYHAVPKDKGLAYCLAQGCICKCYEYIPYFDLKCMCRHSYKEHNRNTKMCNICKKCLGFVTNWSCKCGMKYQMHETVFEKKMNLKPVTQRVSNVVEFLQPKLKKLAFCNYESFEQEHKQNLKDMNYIRFDRSTDTRTYQLHKFDAEITKNCLKQHKIQQFKQKQLQRINIKFSGINFQDHLQRNSQLTVLGFHQIYKPKQTRKITPLQVIIRPHNYNPVKLEKILEKQYKKHENYNINIYQKQN